MIKYDCSKVTDYMHEVKRMCNFHDGCGSCPLAKVIFNDCNSLDQITPKAIELAQKWSDENPEKVRLTKEERILLECLADDDVRIYRRHTTLCLEDSWDDECAIYIKNTLFPFIEDGKVMPVAELLQYEVRED